MGMILIEDLSVRLRKVFYDLVKSLKNNLVSFDSKENVEINFLLWVDGLDIANLVKVSIDCYNGHVRYDEKSIEVLDVVKL